MGSYTLFKNKVPSSLGKFLIVSFLLVSLILTPTLILGDDNFGNPCGGDVLAAYEKVGKELRKMMS